MVENEHEKRDIKKFPYPVLSVIIFLLLGFVWDLWEYAWIVFLTIPIFYALVSDEKRIIKLIPLVLAVIYLALGFIWGLWATGWIVFLLIPIIGYFVREPKSCDNSVPNEPNAANVTREFNEPWDKSRK